MKKFLAVFLLCAVPIVAAQTYDSPNPYYMEEALDNAGRTMATMWDNSFTCSMSCMMLSMQKGAPWSPSDYIRPDKDITATYPAYLAASCDQHPKIKQCFSQCPDGPMKSMVTTLSAPSDTMCSEKFQNMIKNNIHCVSDSSISSIFKQCVQTCPWPDCRENGLYPQYMRSLNIPTLVKSCGPKACEFANCVKQCFANRLVTDTKCDPKAVDGKRPARGNGAFSYIRFAARWYENE